MTASPRQRMEAVFNALGAGFAKDPHGLRVTCPADGSVLAEMKEDGIAELAGKIEAAKAAQRRFAKMRRNAREALLEGLSAAVKAQAGALGELITLEGGKTVAEGKGEADGAGDIIVKTVKDAQLAEFGGMIRTKERPPVGLVGLITSFNFPLAVANWTIAPALLAGNAVVWKPSEKTPLTAVAYKAVFDAAMGEFKDLVQVLIGGRELGAGLVSDKEVSLVSATGSVGMGRGILAALEGKAGDLFPPILELGGNNGVIFGEVMNEAHREWAVGAVLNSFFGTAGQRCTNTRRLIVHGAHYDAVVGLLQKHIGELVASGVVVNPLGGASNAFGYGPLIDGQAFALFEKAKQEAVSQGGTVWGGKRLMGELEDAYYVEPALALMSKQSAVVHEETFAPLLYVMRYEGGVDVAIGMMNAPENAGLVSGIYTQSQREADVFAAGSEAGHVVINSAKGTGTPAFGMGFGGNKASGEGEILNGADPLRAFTRSTGYRRIAQNKDVVME